MSEWKEIELGEVADVQTGPFGSQLKNEQYITGGTPVVTVEHIQDFRIIDFDYPSITDEDKERLSKYLMKEGDILFTRVGSVDLSAYVSKGHDGWMFSSRMLRVRPNEEINSRFLSYFFQQQIFRDYIVNIAVGATMPSINTGILKTIPISYPPLDDQNVIAEILSTLDDKIDLLHRQNQTLEQMAETLFRQWFVEEADDNWEEVLLEDLIVLKQGKYIKAEELSEDKSEEFKFPLYGGNGIRGYLNSYKYDSPKVAITCRGNGCGLVQLLDPFSTVSNSCIVFDNVETVSTWFLYYYSKVLDFASVTSGSAQPQITITDIGKLELTIPDKTSLDAFDNQVNTYHQKVLFNKTQIRTLTALRDTLLPKLMSGEVRVEMAKKFSVS